MFRGETGCGHAMSGGTGCPATDILSIPLCWWYWKYVPGDTMLEKLEAKPRAARRGLVGDPDPIPPWAFRKLSRN